MKTFLFCIAGAISFNPVFSQGNVGIGTTTPDSSAILHIVGEGKGILMPKVYLSWLGDKTNIVKPANDLIVFNSNPNLKWGKGLYINESSKETPSWVSLSDLKLPYYKSANTSSDAFTIENYSSDVYASAIKGNNPKGYGVEAASLSGIGTYAHASDGVGTYTISESGYGLKTYGKLYIGGNGQTPAAGKVLTSDAQGNATWEGGVAFSVSGIMDNVAVKHSIVPFAIKDYDLGNNYNLGTHTFTAPTKGIYHFDIQVTYGYLSADFQSAMTLKLVRNEVETYLARHTTEVTGATFSSQSLGKDVFLQPGDKVFVYVDAYDMDPQPIYKNYEMSYFTGRLVTTIK